MVELATELLKLGHEVTLYSATPSHHIERFGLHRRHHRSLFAVSAPMLAAQKFAPKLAPHLRNTLMSKAIDAGLATCLRPCDFFIANSGAYVRALSAARAKYGAQVWLQRFSRHIHSQAEILAAIPGATTPPKAMVAREIDGYAIADRIVVPSRHVAESFERDPDAQAKLFVNPFGADLERFHPSETETTKADTFQIVFAGGWSLRKGCDLLTRAVEDISDVEVHHYGVLGDAPFPLHDRRFVHHGHVSQQALSAAYSAADLFVHPSREEGLAVVQAQALASGLPLLCTDRTGGADLAHTPRLADRITIVPHDDVDALRAGIEDCRRRYRASPPAPLDAADRAALSWRAYAERYERALLAAYRA